MSISFLSAQGDLFLRKKGRQKGYKQCVNDKRPYIVFRQYTAVLRFVRCFLFVTQRFDRVESRRLAGREVAEGQADRGGESDREQDRRKADNDSHPDDQCSERRNAYADCCAERTA